MEMIAQRKIAAAQDKVDAELAAERAEKDARENANRAEREAREASLRAAEKARAAADAARQKEIARQKAEAKQKLDEKLAAIDREARKQADEQAILYNARRSKDKNAKVTMNVSQKKKPSIQYTDGEQLMRWLNLESGRVPAEGQPVAVVHDEVVGTVFPCLGSLAKCMTSVSRSTAAP